MGPWERIWQVVDRVQVYPWWQVALEMLVIGLLVFVVFRFVQGTRAAGALKGLFLVLVIGTLTVRILGQRESFQRLTFIYENFLTIAAVALIVIFQPELRRGLTRLGEAPLFRRERSQAALVVEAITEAAGYLAKARFGALVVVERDVPVKGITEGGVPLNAHVSAALLQTLFYPGTALHDLAVVIVGDKVAAAGVQLPLAEPGAMSDSALGSRHRAAVGLSMECDAVVVVVSEETGQISVAERGTLTRGLTPTQLSDLLTRRLQPRRPGSARDGLRTRLRRAAKAAPSAPAPAPEEPPATVPTPAPSLSRDA